MPSRAPSAAPSRRVEVCRDAASYGPLLPNPFGRELLDSTRGTALDGPMVDLVSTWRQASDAHALPMLLARAVPDGLRAYLEAPTTTEIFEKLFEDCYRQAAIHSGSPLNHKQRVALRTIAENKSKVLAREADAAKREFQRRSIEQAWGSYLEAAPFRSMLAGLSSFAFTTVYYGYETYAGRVVALLSGKAAPRNSAQFRDGLVAQFDVEAARAWWEDTPVRAARLIRNAHVHRADRLEPSEVPDVETFVPCQGSFALVTAVETHRLVAELRRRVLEMTNRALAAQREVPTKVDAAAAKTAGPGGCEA